MFTPEPYGLHVPEGFRLSGSDSAFIKGQVAILRNRLDLADQKAGRRYATLPSGNGTILITESFGITRVVVQPTVKITKQELIDELRFELPVIYSGRFHNMMWDSEDPDTAVQVITTQQCRLRLSGYNYTAVKSMPVRIADKRFNVITPSDVIRNFMSPRMIDARMKWAQVRYLRPNWWSGTMAAAIQLIRGYGRQDQGKEYPPNIIEFEEGELPHFNYETMPYAGRFVEDGEIQYRFSFDSTHGITFDDANEPWLVHISGSGVYVMPLPVIPETSTARFREWCEQVGDGELLQILDRFGAIPTGEGFPENRKPYEDVGLIQRVCDTSDFYEGGAYAYAIGWSFNDRGHSAVNCCKKRKDDTGYGETHLLTLDLKPIPQVVPDEVSRRDRLFNLIMRERPISDIDERKAFLFMIRHADINDVDWSLSRYKIGMSHFRLEVNKWFEYEMPDVFNHRVKIDVINEGYVYYKKATDPLLGDLYNPQIKFPNTLPHPMTGDIGSYTMDFEESSGGQICNTTVFAYFSDNSLKMVNYFYDPRNFTPKNESDKPPCAVMGSWTEVTYSGGAALGGHWYTNDIDDREPIPVRTVTTKTESRPLGFDEGHVSFMGVGVTTARITRNFVTNTYVVRTTSESKSLNIGVTIPWAYRDGVLYASKTSSSNGTRDMYWGSISTIDPHSYYAYTYHGAMAYWRVSISPNNGYLDPEEIEPEPKEGTPVVIIGADYHPYRCSDTFEEGGWLSTGDMVTDMFMNEAGKLKVGSYPIGPSLGQPARSITQPVETITEGSTYFTYRKQPDVCNTAIPDNHYFMKSPQPFLSGLIMYRIADRNCLGLKYYAAVNEKGGHDGKDMTTNRYWGYTTLVKAGETVCQFMGVINV